MRLSLATVVSSAIALSSAAVPPAVAQAPQPDGAGLERGTLRASWTEPAEGCEGRPHFLLHEYNADFFVLRQSGCTNYEKPFLYLLFGDGQALLLDSGAKNADVAGAVRAALQRWADHHGGRVPRLIVAHSHAHGDHVAGDAQLGALPNTTVVGTSPEAVAAFFGIHNWPVEAATFDLGGRMLDVIPIPGHERASIAVYDRLTGILLTGDTMYPGRLYVADAAAFPQSVRRLVEFTRGRPIAHILGAHIEQARTPFLDYPIGTRFQPDEHALELSVGQLYELNDALAQMDGQVVRRAMRDFTVWPVGAAANAAGAATPATPSWPSPADLDAIAQRIIAQERVVGASVLVARGNQILLHKGYGYADLGLESPARDETVYHVVGPMMPFTGVAVMQLVERGKLSLDDDVARLVPEFPLQGHHVTVRQLLNHTSGIVDYHYLGDAIDGTSRLPKALDEVMALYAGKPWVNEPGKTWDWSISGFQLLVTIVERTSGQSFEQHMRENIFAPAGLRATTLCDDFTLTRGLAHGYRRSAGGHVAANESDMAFNYDLRYCSTVGDLYDAWRAVREHKLLRPETLTMMSTAEGPAMHMSATDPKMQYGLALTLNHEDDHRSRGQHGSLLGYAGSMYEFPDDSLTVVVLTNTENQNAYVIARGLARAMLGLPELPRPATAVPPRTLTDQTVSAAERAGLTGRFLLKYDKLPPDLHGSFTQYRRTYRVFDENGRLMMEPLGQGAERLLKQEDGTFGISSSPGTVITFVMQNGHAARMQMDSPGGGRALAGDRISRP
jgi:hydroxyacylglutathione hydrolase